MDPLSELNVPRKTRADTILYNPRVLPNLSRISLPIILYCQVRMPLFPAQRNWVECQYFLLW